MEVSFILVEIMVKGKKTPPSDLDDFVMDMVLLLNIASKPTYSFLYDMYNDVEPSTNHCEQKNKPRIGTQGFQC
jgi:hypothetical protein